jgi:hypothetical protein
MAYGRKSLKDKTKAVARKLTLVAAFGAAAAAPAYYEYGTVQTQEVKVRAIHEDGAWNDKSGKYEHFNRIVDTSKGSFRNENTYFWLKRDAKTEAIQDMFEEGKTYSVRTYGHLPFGIGTPNIISAREVTQDELDARKAEKKAQQPDAKTSDAGKPATAVTASPAVRVVVSAQGYDIEMIAPPEYVQNIRIEKVTPSAPLRIVQPPQP